MKMLEGATAIKNHSKLSQPLPDLTFWINQVSSMVPPTGAKKSLESSFFFAVDTNYAEIGRESRLFFSIRQVCDISRDQLRFTRQGASCRGRDVG
jgi:hypothetical protein